jgi:hypothetical protein
MTDQARSRYPSRVIDHEAIHQVRTVSRRVRRGAGVLSLALLLTLATTLPASADTPEGWADAPDVNGLDYLLVLVIIPLALAAVISLLTVLPSLIGDKGYEPGQTWRSEPEWFGGRRVDDAEAPQAIEAADADRGGASGKW